MADTAVTHLTILCMLVTSAAVAAYCFLKKKIKNKIKDKTLFSSSLCVIFIRCVFGSMQFIVCARDVYFTYLQYSVLFFSLSLLVYSSPIFIYFLVLFYIFIFVSLFVFTIIHGYNTIPPLRSLVVYMLLLCPCVIFDMYVVIFAFVCARMLLCVRIRSVCLVYSLFSFCPHKQYNYIMYMRALHA